MPDNDEQLTVDVVDEGFMPSEPRPDGFVPGPTGETGSETEIGGKTEIGGAGVAVDVEGLTSSLSTDEDDRAISTFLSGEVAMGSLRERPWTRFVSMSAYALRDAVRGIRRRPALAASAALTVSLCALLAGGAAIARAGVDATMARWADGVEFVVYLQPGATDSDIERVGDELRAADGVRDVTPISQEQAFEEYQRLYADEETMVEAVTPDLLPPSFRVAPDDADPGLIQKITRPLASDPDVYQVVTADDAVQDVRDLSGAVSGFGTWLAVVLGVVGIVLSATMIRSSIASRQREIDMMRSFGAGRSYIAAPVAIEGVLIGLVGAGFAAIGLALAMGQASGSKSSVVTSLLPPASEARTVIVLVFVVTVVVCTAVSILTTANSLRKAR